MTDKKSAAKAVKPAEPAAKYGVDDMAKYVGLSPEVTRAKLRGLNIAKLGKAYGWNTQTDLHKDGDKIKASMRPTPRSVPDKPKKLAPKPKAAATASA